jgi:hypothetical protein
MFMLPDHFGHPMKVKKVFIHAQTFWALWKNPSWHSKQISGSLGLTLKKWGLDLIWSLTFQDSQMVKIAQVVIPHSIWLLKTFVAFHAMYSTNSRLWPPFFCFSFVFWVMGINTSYSKSRKLLYYYNWNKKCLFFFFFFGGEGRISWAWMVSNPNVVKLINYVWWVSSLSKCTLHLGFEKCILTTTPSRHEMIISKKPCMFETW